MRAADKQSYRQRLQRLRSEIPAQSRREFDASIRKQVLSLSEVMSATTVFCYISFADEVDTHELIKILQAQGKVIVVPKTLPGGMLSAIPLSAWTELQSDSFGILVPRSSTPFASTIDVCLTPGLGFSRTGQRLGYGRGYYDGWFAAHPPVYKTGLAYDCQLLDELPTDETDVPVDMVVTEAGIHRIS